MKAGGSTVQLDMGLFFVQIDKGLYTAHHTVSLTLGRLRQGPLVPHTLTDFPALFRIYSSEFPHDVIDWEARRNVKASLIARFGESDQAFQVVEVSTHTIDGKHEKSGKITHTNPCTLSSTSRPRAQGAPRQEYRISGSYAEVRARGPTNPRRVNTRSSPCDAAQK